MVFFGQLTRWSVNDSRIELHFAADCFPSGDVPLPTAAGCSTCVTKTRCTRKSPVQ